MSAARVISGHHGASRNFTSDAAQFMSDEALVAGAKMGHGSFLTSFTNVIAKGCFGLLIASLDIVRMPGCGSREFSQCLCPPQEV